MIQMETRSAHGARRPAGRASPHFRCPSRPERGVVAVMFAAMLLLIIGFFGLALDLSRLYNRKAEMQAVADSVALAAAKKLNGSASGINDALAAAHTVVELVEDKFKPKYDYKLMMSWSNAAIKFGTSADGSTGWMDAATATASPSDVAFVRVDTSELDSAYGSVDMVFMPALSSSLTTVKISQVSVAGRARINVTPFAICAMSTTQIGQRKNVTGNTAYDELVEYGFRRGVSYDLMNLSSYKGTPDNFLVDPIALPGSGSSASNFAVSTVGPYVCTGTMAVPKVAGGSVSVQSGFPLGALFPYLNSRFDQYNGECDPSAAPPDTNVKQYTAATLPWTSPKPTSQVAVKSPIATILQTIADDPPTNQTPTDYGPLWAFARPIPMSSYTPTEPASGYTPFAANLSTWAKLYPTGPGLTGYPVGATVTPYFAAGGSFALAPSIANRPGIQFRRVLNVPLLSCPVSGSTATVLAIGRIFMTVPATASKLSAEFAGLANDQRAGGAVEFYQ